MRARERQIRRALARPLYRLAFWLEPPVLIYVRPLSYQERVSEIARSN